MKFFFTLILALVLYNPALAGELDLRSFGASGSRQTMNCTATGNSNVLTNCSGGDFVVVR